MDGVKRVSDEVWFSARIEWALEALEVGDVCPGDSSVAAKAGRVNRRPILSCWIDHALELEEDNRELRAMMVNLLVAIASNRDLVEFATCEVEGRWPSCDEEAA